MPTNSKGRARAGGSTGYLSKAPPALIQLHGRIGNGSDALGRLLTDKRMRRSWVTLARYITSDAKWRALWSEIANALHQSKNPKTLRANNRESYRRAAVTARDTANMIEGGALDLMAYELFPGEVMNLNGAASWQQLGSLERAEKAGQMLKEWPSIVEVLRELESRADRLAIEVMKKPSLVERLTRESRAIAFVRYMADYFARACGGPLYGTVAVIASVALQDDITKAFVAQQVSRRKG